MEHINNLESGCSAHDPTEDTESEAVAVGGMMDILVAAPTIRLRILKGLFPAAGAGDSSRSCSAHDPTEDTESGHHQFELPISGLVAAPTIRLRILKGLPPVRIGAGEPALQRPRSD